MKTSMAKAMMACALACLAAPPAPAYEASSLDGATLAATIGPGFRLLQRLDAHLNDDRELDTIYLAQGEDAYRIGVILAYRSDGAFVHDALHPLVLPDLHGGPPTLQVRKDVLVVRDASGGSTATEATRRYRYDPNEHEMLLIGLDAHRYSRTQAHDSLKLSWNLLTGAHVVERGKVVPDDAPGDAAYLYGPPERTLRKSQPVWMVHTPDPDDLLDAELVPADEDRD